MAKRLRLGSSGPAVRRNDGTDPSPGDIVTADLDGNPAWEPGSGPPPVGFNTQAVNITFNMVNGLQDFIVAVPGVVPGNAVWTSVNGDTIPAGERVGANGGYCSAPDQVTLWATYEGATSSVTAPMLVFWQP